MLRQYNPTEKALAQSLYQEELMYPGNRSEILHIITGRDCNRVQVMVAGSS
jgi:hypothetical protein